VWFWYVISLCFTSFEIHNNDRSKKMIQILISHSTHSSRPLKYLHKRLNILFCSIWNMSRIRTTVSLLGHRHCMCCSGKIWGSYRGVVEDWDFSGMWHIVIGWVVREVLKDRIAFILGVRQCKKKLDSWHWRWRHCIPSNNQELLPSDTVLHPWRQRLNGSSHCSHTCRMCYGCNSFNFNLF
jgi:hypothetical protein